MAKVEMAPGWLLRAGGLTLLTGATVFVFHLVLRSVVTAGSDPVLVAETGTWVLINALGVVGAVLVLLGLPAVFARLSGAGVAASVGLALLVVSWAFFGVFLSMYSLLVVPWLADRAPSLLDAQTPAPPAFLISFGAALLAWVVGATLAAIPFVRRRARPLWAGYGLFGSALLLAIGNLVIAPSGPSDNLLLNVLSNTGPVLLLSVFGDLGRRLWSESSAQRPTS